MPGKQIKVTLHHEIFIRIIPAAKSLHLICILKWDVASPHRLQCNDYGTPFIRSLAHSKCKATSEWAYKGTLSRHNHGWWLMPKLNLIQSTIPELHLSILSKLVEEFLEWIWPGSFLTIPRQREGLLPIHTADFTFVFRGQTMARTEAPLWMASAAQPGYKLLITAWQKKSTVLYQFVFPHKMFWSYLSTCSGISVHRL